MRIFIILISGFIFCALIATEVKSDQLSMGKEHEILLDQDRAMAKVSSEKGILNALYAFMTEKAVLQPVKGNPIYGKAACERLIRRVTMDDWKGKINWEPMWANISAAQDLAYTYGRYENVSKENNDEGKADSRYYFSIWEKDKDGAWKVAFSHGLILLTDLKPTRLDSEDKMDMSKLDDATKEVVGVEREFCRYCAKKGIAESFYQFMAEAGIALGTSGKPKKRDFFAELIASAKEKKEEETGKEELVWEPIFSYVSASKEMAYNYGPSKYTYTNAENNIEAICGFFVTVWEKQANGAWKFLIDGGSVLPCE